eukprot:NODE_112_length_19362_cov_0.399678.p1 type:complete len:1332 gc:universal NODE_112_length_19362_cov_0.399678:3359-7354(+)
MEFEIGQQVTVQISSGTAVGTIAFIGETKFKPGTQWIGLNLQDPIGKNNGTVDGVQYFECNSNHGIFVPVSKISQKKIVLDPKKKSFLSRGQLESQIQKLQQELDNAIATIDDYKSNSSAVDGEDQTVQELNEKLQSSLSIQHTLQQEIEKLKSKPITSELAESSNFDQLIAIKSKEVMDLRSELLNLKSKHQEQVDHLQSQLNDTKSMFDEALAKESMSKAELESQLLEITLKYESSIALERELKEEIAQLRSRDNISRALDNNSEVPKSFTRELEPNQSFDDQVANKKSIVVEELEVKKLLVKKTTIVDADVEASHKQDEDVLGKEDNNAELLDPNQYSEQQSLESTAIDPIVVEDVTFDKSTNDIDDLRSDLHESNDEAKSQINAADEGVKKCLPEIPELPNRSFVESPSKTTASEVEARTDEVVDYNKNTLQLASEIGKGSENIAEPEQFEDFQGQIEGEEAKTSKVLPSLESSETANDFLVPHSHPDEILNESTGNAIEPSQEFGDKNELESVSKNSTDKSAVLEGAINEELIEKSTKIAENKILEDSFTNEAINPTSENSEVPFPGEVVAETMGEQPLTSRAYSEQFPKPLTDAEEYLVAATKPTADIQSANISDAQGEMPMTDEVVADEVTTEQDKEIVAEHVEETAAVEIETEQDKEIVAEHVEETVTDEIAAEQDKEIAVEHVEEIAAVEIAAAEDKKIVAEHVEETVTDEVVADEIAAEQDKEIVAEHVEETAAVEIETEQDKEIVAEHVEETVTDEVVADEIAAEQDKEIVVEHVEETAAVEDKEIIVEHVEETMTDEVVAEHVDESVAEHTEETAADEDKEIVAEHVEETAAVEIETEQDKEIVAEHVEETAAVEIETEQDKEIVAEHVEETAAVEIETEQDKEIVAEHVEETVTDEIAAEQDKEIIAEHVEETAAVEIETEQDKEIVVEHVEETVTDEVVADEVAAEHVDETAAEHAEEITAVEIEEVAAEQDKEIAVEHVEETAAVEIETEQDKEIVAEHVEETAAVEIAAEHVDESVAEHSEEITAYDLVVEHVEETVTYDLVVENAEKDGTVQLTPKNIENTVVYGALAEHVEKTVTYEKVDDTAEELKIHVLSPESNEAKEGLLYDELAKDIVEVKAANELIVEPVAESVTGTTIVAQPSSEKVASLLTAETGPGDLSSAILQSYLKTEEFGSNDSKPTLTENIANISTVESNSIALVNESTVASNVPDQKPDNSHKSHSDLSSDDPSIVVVEPQGSSDIVDSKTDLNEPSKKSVLELANDLEQSQQEVYRSESEHMHDEIRDSKPSVMEMATNLDQKEKKRSVLGRINNWLQK